MKKKATAKKAKGAKRQYWQQQFLVKGVSKTCLKRIEGIVRAECETSGGVVAFANPSPSCGGPGDPC